MNECDATEALAGKVYTVGILVFTIVFFVVVCKTGEFSPDRGIAALQLAVLTVASFVGGLLWPLCLLLSGIGGFFYLLTFLVV
jgi:uncharacterized membrane protein